LCTCVVWLEPGPPFQIRRDRSPVRLPRKFCGGLKPFARGTAVIIPRADANLARPTPRSLRRRLSGFESGMARPDAAGAVSEVSGNGGWRLANERNVKVGSTNATAAAITTLRNLNVPVNQSAGDWLLARCQPEGFSRGAGCAHSRPAFHRDSVARSGRTAILHRWDQREVPRFHRHTLDKRRRFSRAMGGRPCGLRIHLLRVAGAGAFKFCNCYRPRSPFGASDSKDLPVRLLLKSQSIANAIPVGDSFNHRGGSSSCSKESLKVP